MDKKGADFMAVVKSELRVRKGNNGKYECIVVTLLDNGEVSRTVLCERDTEEEAMAVIQNL